MIKIIICLICSIILLQIECRFGRQEEEPIHDEFGENKNITLKRYVVEDSYFPPIFGSYKYNPVLRKFDLPENLHNSTPPSVELTTNEHDRSLRAGPHGKNSHNQPKIELQKGVRVKSRRSGENGYFTEIDVN